MSYIHFFVRSFHLLKKDEELDYGIFRVVKPLCMIPSWRMGDSVPCQTGKETEPSASLAFVSEGHTSEPPGNILKIHNCQDSDSENLAVGFVLCLVLDSSKASGVFDMEAQLRNSFFSNTVN